MIIDAETDFLYLSDQLPELHPLLFGRFEKVLKEHRIPYGLLPGTKDIWAVDYMPVQTSRDEFIQFRYEPDYLMDTAENRATISDVASICRAIGIRPVRSDINLDGGNVVKWKDRVIVGEKVFSENPELSEDELFDELLEYFNLAEDRLHFVPEDPLDFTGHADGMVRFADENTLLVNDYRNEDPEFQTLFTKAIEHIGLDVIKLPYQPEDDPELISAVGLYLNYLEMKQAVIAPIFNLSSDEEALRVLRSVFTDKPVVPLECSELARTGGGILNCVSWNIAR